MREWIEAAQTGDRESFERLVRHFRPLACTIAYDRLGDSYLAEDAVQEAFTEAFLYIDQVREPSAFAGWLKRIVIRQCLRLRRRKTHPSAMLEEADAIADTSPGVLEQVELRELRQLVHQAVDGLPSKLRIAVSLFYLEGQPIRTIAEALDTTPSALKKRLFEARSKLKGALPVRDLIHVYRQLSEGGVKMLHIVNGDVFGSKLKQSQIPGEVLVWREIYTVGPVFTEPAEPENRAARAAYIEQALGVPQAEFIRHGEEQERALAAYQDYDEVVLWFEYDLFDQTMLAYLLHWFSERPLGKTKLSLLSIGAFPGIASFRGLGQLNLRQVETLSGLWQAVSGRELRLGADLWQAFTADTADPLVELLKGDTSALPFAREAFLAHLSKFPSVRNGLGSIEQATLDVLTEGTRTPIELFRLICEQHHVLGMGDLEYWSILKTLAGGDEPIVRVDGSETFPSFQGVPDNFASSRIGLTELGSLVQEGKADRVARCGIDQWYGGVHLHGRGEVLRRDW
ncbi:sigma-70 family RNA polymerase sigma factor [Paenibacillus aurantiacus]|uniref:Sigma-70 family RNA polymerase sigma factor n=1 Tax=Paenibacillus aurantiacus TaxID=1936118 RepID=A0ABV5KS39_9BACL